MFSEFGEILRGRYRRERLKVPTLIMQGDRDRAVRPEIVRGYGPYADELRVELVPGATERRRGAAAVQPTWTAARRPGAAAGRMGARQTCPPRGILALRPRATA